MLESHVFQDLLKNIVHKAPFIILSAKIRTTNHHICIGTDSLIDTFDRQLTSRGYIFEKTLLVATSANSTKFHAL